MDSADNLGQIETDAWQALRDAARDAASPLRYLTFCTLGPDGFPRARILVLRGVKTQDRALEFHTDIRSAKWVEVTKEPRSSVIGFSPTDRTQLRLEGHATLHPPGSAQHQQSWDRLSNWTRHTYCSGPPGEILTAPPDKADAGVDQPAPTRETTEAGRNVFGVVTFQALSLDWVRLSRQGNRRALFNYGGTSPDPASSWINP